jgi:hypothetical protein
MGTPGFESLIGDRDHYGPGRAMSSRRAAERSGPVRKGARYLSADQSNGLVLVSVRALV